MVLSGFQDRAYLIFLLLNGSSLVFLDLGLEVAAAHFDAQLISGPHITHGSPDLLLV